jgi:5-methylcytosine-specific restriction endonuclease McrA
LANERTRDWRRRNPEKAPAATKRWLENNPENKMKYRANRARRIDAAWLEDVDVIVVYERDNWTCQSCGIKCSPTAKRGEPGCPSLDHVIPLSVGIFRGGFHSYANTQLLCHSCNCKKKDKTPK